MNKPHAIQPGAGYTMAENRLFIGTDPRISLREPYEKNNTTIIEVVVEDGRRAPAIAGVLKDEYNLGTIRSKSRWLARRENRSFLLM